MSGSDSDNEFVISRENLTDIKLNKIVDRILLSPKNPRSKSSNLQKPLLESPIIGTNNPSNESPVIGINSPSLCVISPQMYQSQSTIPQQLSPVIDRRYMRRKRRKRHSETANTRLELMSPDLFGSTQDIEPDSPMPSSPRVLTQASIEIEHCDSQESQQSIRIEPFPSQLGSEVEEIDSFVISLYHKPAMRRKKFRKNSLAHKLNEVLKNQNARVKIWSHEKLNGIGDVGEEPLVFIFKRFWKEYGNTVLECELSEVMVLINLGLNTEWECGAKYELYKPYQVKTVLHHGNFVDCYFNVKKYGKCKDRLTKVR